MNKYIQLPVQLNLQEYDRQTVLRVSFDRSAVKEWCLCLGLLNEQLIESLTVSDLGGKFKLELRILSEPSQEQSVAEVGSTKTSVQLTSSDLEYTYYFFMRYYRDGVAEVDHIDLQIQLHDAQTFGYLTFDVPDSLPELSIDELKNRLDLPPTH